MFVFEMFEEVGDEKFCVVEVGWFYVGCGYVV